MMRTFKRRAARFFRNALDLHLLARGYRIMPYQLEDLRLTFIDPREFHYYGGHPILANFPAATGRCGLFPVDSHETPYARAYAVHRREGVDLYGALLASLRRYHGSVDIGTVFDRYGKPGTPEDLSQDLQLPAPSPWNRQNKEGFHLYKKELRARFNEDLGRKGVERSSAEAHRFADLLVSIEKHGFLRNNSPDGDIGATVLMREDGQWRWLASAGNHRAIALGILGLETIPVRMDSIVYRQDVGFWPNVKNGTYTPAYAREIFDRVFDAVPPESLTAWLSEG